MPQVDDVLLPTLEALSDGNETASSDIRDHVAAVLDVAPTELGKKVDFAFGRYLGSGKSGAGFVEKTSSGKYKLTPRGAEFLARSPSSLTLEDLRNDQSPTGVQPNVEATAVQLQIGPNLDLSAAWELAGQKVEDDEGALRRIADRTAMLEEVQTWPDADRASREFMELLWHDQRVVGHLGLGEYDLTGALDDGTFWQIVVRHTRVALPAGKEARVIALQAMAERLMEVASRHSVRASGSGQGDRPVVQTWRAMTALFPYDFAGLQISGFHRDYDDAVLFRKLGGKRAGTAGKHRWILDRLAKVAAPGSGFSGEDSLRAVSRRMEQVQKLFRIVSEDEPEPAGPIVDPEPHPPSSYSTADAMEDLFLPKRRFHDILNSIQSRRNLILQGPPGVGKTFIAKRIAWCVIRRKDDSPVEMVQFHQSYAYEDFVQGFRPTKKGGFRRRDGVFFEFCKRAERDLKTPHIFIIDEINRGNLSRIFGELLMLLEADKRGPRHAVRLTYQRANERFSVPENVYILGLMNTADRSLAVVDYALRRRFAFEELDPKFGRKFQNHLRNSGAARDLIDRIVGDMEKLNRAIRGDDDLGHGFEIGHSYFVPQRGERADENWRRHRIRSQILPLLREYWFDRKDEIEKWEKRLLDPPDGD